MVVITPITAIEVARSARPTAESPKTFSSLRNHCRPLCEAVFSTLTASLLFFSPGLSCRLCSTDIGIAGIHPVDAFKSRSSSFVLNSCAAICDHHSLGRQQILVRGSSRPSAPAVLLDPMSKTQTRQRGLINPCFSYDVLRQGLKAFDACKPKSKMAKARWRSSGSRFRDVDHDNNLAAVP